MAKKSKSAPEPGVDALLDDLERVVGDLEGGELALEDALGRFEEGVKLARKAGQQLDAVEQRVEQLLEERDEVVAFADADSDEEST